MSRPSRPVGLFWPFPLTPIIAKTLSEINALESWENEVERGDKINPKYIRFLLLILANLSDNRASHIKEVPYAHSQSEDRWPQINL